MSNKVFSFLVIFLSLLIGAALVALIISVIKYNNEAYPQEKPSYFTEKNKNEETHTKAPEETKPEETKPTENPPATTSNSKYILPSDTRLITESDIINMDYDTLNKAYNEVFARYGHEFSSKNLKEYFEAQDWYKEVPGKKVGIEQLTEIEAKNIQTIKARIDKIKGN